jgi:hypothetical protein
VTLSNGMKYREERRAYDVSGRVVEESIDANADGVLDEHRLFGEECEP